ncbi:MAG: zinc-binding dehydrogenase [Bdellovibrionia bacterium]
MERIYLVRNGGSKTAFEFKTEPDPVPGPGQVRIKVEASGLNFADVLARLGLYPDAPKLPCVIGYEVVGRIDQAGPGVDAKIGERVLSMTAFGGYASHVVVPADNVIPIPANLDAATATALGTQFTTAWYCAEEMVRLHKGDHVLIQAAAGGVGTALVQMAKRRGCIIYGTSSNPEKLKLLKELGVQHPINYREKDFETEIRRLRNGKGVDYVFDSLGGTAFKKGMRLLQPGGRMVFIGAAEMAGPTKSIFKMLKTALGFGLIPPIRLVSTSTGVIGVNLYHVSQSRPDVLRECFRNCIELVFKGELRPILGKAFPARDIADAHDFLGSGKSTGKVALVWN